jgi:hypothetical protein
VLFEGWRVGDAERLVQRLARSLRTVRTALHGGNAIAAERAELLAQMEELRGQIAGLGPAGLAALHAFDLGQ